MENVIILQLFICALLGAFAFWHLGVRKNLLDTYRQGLFELRDELFDYAAVGKIAFDDEAYRYLRRRINVMSRFAHRLTTLDMILSELIWKNITTVKKETEDFEKHLINVKNSDSREFIQSINQKSNKLALKFFIKSNLTSPLVVLYYIIKSLFNGKTKKIKLKRSYLGDFKNDVAPLWTVFTIERKNILNSFTRPKFSNP
jgi:hypothetical protein